MINLPNGLFYNRPSSVDFLFVCDVVLSFLGRSFPQTQDQINFRRARAARLIQRMWRRVVSDPNHSMCRRRLLREFNEIAEV
jgi:hypothetical protein